jgi:hypothetical protein
LSKERARRCEALVQATRRANPNISYDEAWRVCAAENQQLFDADADQKRIERLEAAKTKCDELLARSSKVGSVKKVVGIRQDI